MLKKLLKLRPISERKLGKPKPVEKFFNREIYLVRSGKERPENTICFSTDTEMTKPIIKQVLEKLYFLDVKKVNTWNKQGKILRGTKGRYNRKEDLKRVIVELNTPVPSDLQSFR
jgi:ribosomal protein L23